MVLIAITPFIAFYLRGDSIGIWDLAHGLPCLDKS